MVIYISIIVVIVLLVFLSGKLNQKKQNEAVFTLARGSAVTPIKQINSSVPLNEEKAKEIARTAIESMGFNDVFVNFTASRKGDVWHVSFEAEREDENSKNSYVDINEKQKTFYLFVGE